MEAKEIFDQAPTFSVYIRHSGVWDMQDLYEFMIDYLRKKKFKFYEKVYKHKHPSPFGVERQYIWQAVREDEDYIQFVIDIYIHTYDAHDVEVTMKDGSRKVFTKGRVWMEFKGNVQFDWEQKFNSRAFYAHIKNFYNKYVLKKRIEGILWDTLWYREMHKLHNAVQERLKMESQGFEHRYWTGVHM